MGALEAFVHELRQPLGTIESIAYYLGLILNNGDARIQEQIRNLQQQVEQSSWIIDCGLQLADASAPSPEAVDLNQLVTQTVKARIASVRFPIQLDLACNLSPVQLDPVRGRALVENLLMLFRFVGETVHLRTCAGPVSSSGPTVLLELESAARGHRSEMTLGAGCALGLQSACRIAEAHGGSIDFEADPVNGIRLRMMLP